MQFQRPVMRQELKLKMTPQLYQAIKLMALPLVDLRLRIHEEIEKNPALEILEDKASVSIDEIRDRNSKSEEYTLFDNTSDPGFSRYQKNGDQDSKRKFIEGTLSRPESLQEHLLWQLRLQPLSEKEFHIGEIVISNLDKNGFHIQEPEILVKRSEIKILYEMIKLIQTFDPLGVCSADYQEALLIQIENHISPVDYAYDIVDKFLKLLEKGKLKEIANKLKASRENIEMAVEFIKELDPLPGRNFVSEVPKYVVPDVMIKLKEGEFVLVLNDEEIPVLGINPFFTDIVDKKNEKKERELKEFVNNSVKDAKWFIRSISRRNDTLLKVCKAIVEFQRDFFKKGPKYLAPLTLKDIASEIDVHETTISRITNGKYIQTEWGVYELKFFFSNPISSTIANGSSFSKESVKLIIKEIIENEKKSHLTDSKIVGILASRGVKLARRTVAKYRKELDILSSFNR